MTAPRWRRQEASMAVKVQTTQDTAMFKTLAKIKDTIEKCWNDIQPHISVCAECRDEGQDASALMLVATVMALAANYVDYTVWTLTPEGEQSEAEQSEQQAAQDTTMVTTLDAICDRLT